MKFLSLRLKDYRNFSETRVQFSPRLNIFLGDNGQGKTNLLESLSLLTQGDAFRFGDNGVLIRHGTHQAVIDGSIERKDLEYRIRADILKSRKTFSVNEKKASSLDIRRVFPSVIFSPESLAAIKEGADLRRELVDDFLVSHHSGNAALISEYRRALKARNKLLRDGLEPDSDRGRLLSVLESFDPGFLRLAGGLTEARTRALRAILPDLSTALGALVGQTPVDISVEYVVSGQNASQWERPEIDRALQQRAFELRDAELSSGVSLVGPHKHDISFLYDQKDSRFYCSQGQQRAIILAFKMAQIVYHWRVHGLYPILMLDDVLSELDSSKRAALISFLHGIQSQVFLTTTDITLPEHFKLERSSVFRIARGEILTTAQE